MKVGAMSNNAHIYSKSSRLSFSSNPHLAQGYLGPTSPARASNIEE